GCVQVYPGRSGDGMKTPTVTTSPPKTTPGTIEVRTGNGQVARIGGSTSSGKPATSTSSSGGLVVSAEGIIPIELSGLAPGSRVTVWLADQFSVSGTVMPDGTISLSAEIPDGLPAGNYTGRVDFTDPSGQQQSILFGFDWEGSTSSSSGIDGTLASGLTVLFLALLAGIALIRFMRRRSDSTESSVA
ncbi:MAG: hypothetical protein ACO321_06545, partial [Ilumatobacteraceae bacterium]